MNYVASANTFFARDRGGSSPLLLHKSEILNIVHLPVGLWSRLEDVTEPWFWVGILSLGAWRFGLFLRRHDGFAASLWTLDPDLVR